MGKYDPLGVFLADQTGCRVHLSFDQFESIIADALPDSACRHREFWANNPAGHVHARVWLDAGWKVETADLTRKTVTFVRSC